MNPSLGTEEKEGNPPRTKQWGRGEGYLSKNDESRERTNHRGRKESRKLDFTWSGGGRESQRGEGIGNSEMGVRKKDRCQVLGRGEMEKKTKEKKG